MSLIDRKPLKQPLRPLVVGLSITLRVYAIFIEVDKTTTRFMRKVHQMKNIGVSPLIFQ